MKKLFLFIIFTTTPFYSYSKDILFDKCSHIIESEKSNSNNAKEILDKGIYFYEKAIELYDKESNTLYYDNAYCLFSLAENKGNIDSKAFLSEFYANGFSIQKNDKKAFSLSLEAANAGSVLALNNLGNYYQNGIGTEKDLRKSAYYYQKAIDDGQLDIAKINLGYAYFLGIGVEKDIEKAITLTKDALSTKNIRFKTMALTNLGGFYQSLGKNEEAFSWTKQAALLGNAVAETNLGVFWGYGIGTSADKEEALHWLNKAIEKNYPEAFFILASMYAKGTPVIEKDPSLAYEYYLKAANKGHGMAQNNLGNWLFYGRYVNKNELEGLKWYLKAANENNIALSMYALYQIYSRGTKDIPQDLEKANYWLERAKQNGFVPPQ